MKPVALPGTGREILPHCLGGVPFGHPTTETGTSALLDRFVTLGGTPRSSAAGIRADLASRIR